MQRYFYLGGVVIVLLAGAAWFTYRAPISLMEMSTRSASSLSDKADFGGVSLNIEYATSTTAQERGLGGRVSIPDDYGMLFVFPKSDYYGIWMKDMFLPIDIFWLDAQGHIIAVSEDVATSTYPNVFYPPTPVKYVLETAVGFAREHGILVGASLLLKK